MKSNNVLARWYTGTKANTLKFLLACHRSDIKTIINTMACLEKKDGLVDWDVACLECRVCSARQVAIMPHEAKGYDHECDICHRMTADTREIESESPLEEDRPDLEKE